MKRSKNRSRKVTPAMAAQMQAKFRQAVGLHQQGQLAQAQTLYRDILKALPDHFDAMQLLGVIALQRRDFQRAVDWFDKAIALKPDFPEACANRGIALKELGQLDAAVTSFDRAIALKPDYAEAYSNRGNVLRELNRPEEAVASYDRAIELRQGYAEAHYSRGNALRELGRLDEALASYDRAIALQPNLVAAYSNRGNVFRDLKQYDAALASYDKAIALKPGHANAWDNRGNVLRELQRFDEAVGSHDQAVALKPDHVEAYSNRGVALYKLNRLDAAVASYDQAIALKPDYADAYWNKSLALLLSGDFEQGWPLYEWRWESDALLPFKRNLSQPQWSGNESLTDKTLLLHSEQGFGDAIQFCRYASLAAERGARVILEVARPLLDLFTGLAGVSELIEKGSPLPEFDYHCPLLSLPLAFRTRLDTIPHPQPYLQVNPVKRAQWTQRLGEKTKPRVGLVWSGRPTHKNDHNRSIPLSTLIAALPTDYEYISLQKEVRESDRAALGSSMPVMDVSDELDDFADTAALCELMDVVISVDTSVAHLSAALGRPTWVLLPFRPDWRWLLDRNDSPWYSSVRLYRQPTIGDWDAVFTRVSADLQHQL